MMCPRGDLNSETGEISLDLGLNSKTGEKSPDRGVHAAMLAGMPRLASSRPALQHDLPVEPERYESVRRHTGIARIAGDNRDGRWLEGGNRHSLSAYCMISGAVPVALATTSSRVLGAN